MYEKTLKHFKNIASIPHCSFETSALGEHIKSHAKSCGYKMSEDEAGNILCIKGEPKICLQSHYDMVCMGVAPNLELYEEDGWLKAKDSSLGADNGMGVAMMMAMMEKHDDLECLFTNDEEVGLLGAEGLELKIESKNLLNLDSEEENEVIIGCAGGVDIFGNIGLEKMKASFKNAYEVIIDGLDGGHSGVNIAKNIPSAIKVLINTLASYKCELVSLEGGERNNSIAKRARAVVFCDEEIISENKHVEIKKLEMKDENVLKNSQKIIGMINSFAQGVREYDEELSQAILSINISTIKTVDGELLVEFFARSMDDEKLTIIKSEMTSLLKGFGFGVEFKNQTSAWKPIKTQFGDFVKSISQKHIKDVKMGAVHAGLECGVIMQKQPHINGVCSIGPTICYPHSVREKCLLSSVEKIVNVVDEVIEGLK